jgi:hypothetical protein
VSAHHVVCRFHDGERYAAALVKIGRTKIHAVVIDDCGVRVISEPLESARYCGPLVFNSEPYPLPRLLKHFKRVGRGRGITDAAKVILAECTLQGETHEEEIKSHKAKS